MNEELLEQLHKQMVEALNTLNKIEELLNPTPKCKHYWEFWTDVDGVDYKRCTECGIKECQNMYD